MRRISVRTHTREEMRDITGNVREVVRDSGVSSGMLHLWVLHTTCALTVNEGADPDVARDLVEFMRGAVPRDGGYRHVEGNADAHIKTSLFGPGLTLLVDDGDLVLGTWQRVFLAEWDGPRTRQIGAIIVASE